MADYRLESEPYTKTFSGLRYNILKNAPVTDIGHAIPNNQWITTEAEDLILALCHCNILGVGDMNMRNTSVDVQNDNFILSTLTIILGEIGTTKFFILIKSLPKS